MSFEINRAHKWMENIENDITGQLELDIAAHYGVEELSELSEDNIAELDAYADELSEDGYLSIFGMCIRNITSWWENENYDDD